MMSLKLALSDSLGTQFYQVVKRVEVGFDAKSVNGDDFDSNLKVVKCSCKFHLVVGQYRRFHDYEPRLAAPPCGASHHASRLYDFQLPQHLA